MPINGEKLVAENIARFGGGFINFVNKTMGKVKKVLDNKITDNMSNTDYSLADLAAMGHPYGRKASDARQPIPHDPYWLVHTQSGQLLSSKSAGVDSANVKGTKLTAYAYVALDPTEAPHANMVIFGTSKMIPRDFMNLSQEQVKDKAANIISNNLRDMVRSFT